jgi:hypothetical protein
MTGREVPHGAILKIELCPLIRLSGEPPEAYRNDAWMTRRELPRWCMVEDLITQILQIFIVDHKPDRQFPAVLLSARPAREGL